MSKKVVVSSVILCMVLVFAGCAGLEQSGLWKKPGMAFGDARITGLDSSGFTMALDLNVSNPNSYGIAYGAMEYKVNLQNTDLFSGKLAQSGNIAAGKTGRVTLPISFKFADILNLVKGGGTDTIHYGLDAAMLFNIPLAGEMKLPVKTEGSLPVPKVPSVSLSSLDVQNISLSGANLLMKVEMENPNVFDLVLDGFDYGLGLNGKSVVSGKIDTRQAVKSKGKKILEVPVQLSFVQGGLAVYNLLTGSGDLRYDLDFNSVLGSSLPVLQDLPFSTRKTGTVNPKR